MSPSYVLENLPDEIFAFHIKPFLLDKCYRRLCNSSKGQFSSLKANTVEWHLTREYSGEIGDSLFRERLLKKLASRKRLLGLSFSKLHNCHIDIINSLTAIHLLTLKLSISSIERICSWKWIQDLCLSNIRVPIGCIIKFDGFVGLRKLKLEEVFSGLDNPVELCLFNDLHILSLVRLSIEQLTDLTGSSIDSVVIVDCPKIDDFSLLGRIVRSAVTITACKRLSTMDGLRNIPIISIQSCVGLKQIGRLGPAVEQFMFVPRMHWDLSDTKFEMTDDLSHIKNLSLSGCIITNPHLFPCDSVRVMLNRCTFPIELMPQMFSAVKVVVIDSEHMQVSTPTPNEQVVSLN